MPETEHGATAQGPPYFLGRSETNIQEVVLKLGLHNNKISYLLQSLLYIKVQYVNVDELKIKVQIKTFYQLYS